ncbi:MULE transposase domain [Fragilaria crotonensis]|nr:MULE transposase domain [Fragilaria crotonensis]
MVSPPKLPGHFFVACFDFSVHHPEFFVDISFYDSLVRAKKRIHQASTAAALVKTVNLFFNKFILHEKKYLSLQQSDTAVLKRVHYKDCPSQKNGHDCGIFAVASVLHLAEHIPLTSTSFSQTHVTNASIVDAAGVEVINNRHVDGSSKPTASQRRSTRSTNPILSEDGIGLSSSTAIDLCWQEDIAPLPNGKKALQAVGKKRDHNEISLTSAPTRQDYSNNNDEGTTRRTTRRSNTKMATSGSTKERDDADASSVKNGADDDACNSEQMMVDTTLYRIMHKAKIDCFKDLDDAFPIIEKYETMTRNRLRIQQSVVDKFRVYRCTSHVACPFLVRFSRRHSDGKFVLSRMNPKHSKVLRPNCAVDGRQLKKRRQGKLQEVVTRVLQTKEGLPVPKDVMKTASNKEYNEDLPYMVAWRAINESALGKRKAGVMNFQLIIPYLDELKKCNPLSLIGYTRGTPDCDIVDLHFFPSIANDVLKTVRPVISLDAAHLRSEYKGMLYIASVLSGGNDISNRLHDCKWERG